MQRICPVCTTINEIPENQGAEPAGGRVCEKCGSRLEPGPASREPAALQDPARDEPGTPASVLDMSGHDQAPTDYLALSMLIAAVILLSGAGYYLIKYLDLAAIGRPVASISRWVKEMDEFGKSILGKKEESPVQKAEQHIRRGNQFYGEQKFDQALKEYGRAIELAPNNHRAFFWRGRTYARKQAYDLAEKDFHQTIKLNPKYVSAFNNLGWLYGRRGENEKSLIYLNRALELQPDSGWTYYYRGRVYYQKGDLKSALKDTQKACQLKFQRACQAYEQLKRDKK